MLALLLSVLPLAVQAPDGVALTLGARVERSISGGASQTFTIPLNAGEAAHVALHSREITIHFSMKTPGGQELQTPLDDLSAGEPERVWACVADTAGDYSLEITSPAPATERGRYTVELRVLRPVGPADQQRIDAQSALVEGAALLEEGGQAVPRAVERFEEALALATEIADVPLEAEILTVWLGQTHLMSGDLIKARAYIERAVAITSDQGPSVRLLALDHLASVYAHLGETQRAFDVYWKALPIARAAGFRAVESSLLSQMGREYLKVEEYAPALEYFQRALAIDSAGDPLSESRSRLDLGCAYAGLRRFDVAFEEFEKALALKGVGLPWAREIEALDHIGMLWLHAPQPDPRKALSFFERGLAIPEVAHYPALKILILRGQGEAYLALGEPDAAFAAAHEALALARSKGPWPFDGPLLVDLARAERDRGHLQKARQRMREATVFYESTRAKLMDEDLRLHYGATIRESYDLYVEILMALHAQSPESGMDAVALEISERGRSRALLQTLREAEVGPGAGVDPELLDAEQDLRHQIRAKAAGPTAMAVASAGTSGTPLDSLLAQYEQVQSQIRQRSPRYAALTQHSGASVGEIQGLLDPDTALLEYHLGENRSYAWLVTPGGLETYTLPAEREIEASVRKLVDAITARNRLNPAMPPERQRTKIRAAEAAFTKEARTLGSQLLGQVHLPLNLKRLVIVPDRALHNLPFAALPIPSPHAATLEPLIARYDVVHLPSAAVLTALRQEHPGDGPAKAIAVFADPVFDRRDRRVAAHASPPPRAPKRARVRGPARQALLSAALRGDASSVEKLASALPRLVYTRTLAKEALQDLPPGDGFEAVDFAANRDAAMSDALRDYKVLIFATHGIVDGRRPALSSIVLSLVDEKGQPQDGFLRLHDIYGLHLNADLVVLAACDTALGPEVRGEGLLGLGRGFMHAGAKRVLASLWEVEEEATVEMVKDLTRRMKSGETGSAAFCAAQRAMYKRHPAWRAAYFWAGFVFQGDWK